MTLVPNVRVNASFPFPALVTGTGPITIAKNNGVWQIGFTINAFGSQNPPSSNYATDYVLAYDAVNKVFFKVSITNLAIAVSNIGAARNQRLVTTTPIVVATTDQIINCNISSGAAACALPSYTTRTGLPLTFKDVGGQAGTNNITLTASAPDTIDGATTFVLNENYQAVTLVPANDGTTTGWSIE